MPRTDMSHRVTPTTTPTPTIFGALRSRDPGSVTLVGPQVSGAEAEIGSYFFCIPFRSRSLGGGVVQEFFQRRFDGSEIVDEARGM
jgi:hypothetical protein